MLDVITGFAIIFAVIATGWLLSRRGIIPKGETRLMFNRVAFYACTPALIFSSVVGSDPQHFFSPVVLVVALAATLTAGLYVAASKLAFRRDVPTTTMGAAASSYFNSVNIGLPVSIYVLGEATHVIPTLLMQMAVFTPIILAFLGSDQDSVAHGSRRRAVTLSVRNALISPVVVASFAGLAVALMGWRVPEPVLEPIRILGGASIPMILMSFGASLTVGGVLSSVPDRPAVITSTALKVAGMPVIAWLCCLVLGIDGDFMYAAVILSALPTAQNVYNYAATYRRGEIIARDTVFLTTFLSLPAMLAVAFLFGR